MTLGIFLLFYYGMGIITSFIVGGNRPIFWDEIILQITWPVHLIKKIFQ